jgi:hypothetical protein
MWKGISPFSGMVQTVDELCNNDMMAHPLDASTAGIDAHRA